MNLEQRGSCEEEKDQLMAEVNALSKACEEAYFELQRLEQLDVVKTNVDPRFELPAHVTTDSVKRTNLNKRLTLSSKVNGIVFGKVEKDVMEDNIIKILAEGRAGPVHFYIMIEMKEDGHECEIQALNASLQDSFHIHELHSWINSCLRKNNLQLLLRGIGEYSELFKNRESLLEWLHTEFTEYFSISEIEDEVGYLIDASHKSSGLKFFQAQWMVKWNKQEYAMRNHFIFVISPVGDFKEELTGLCQRISEMSNTADLKKMWKQVAHGVLEETLKRLEGTSSSGSTSSAEGS